MTVGRARRRARRRPEKRQFVRDGSAKRQQRRRHAILLEGDDPGEIYNVYQLSLI